MTTSDRPASTSPAGERTHGQGSWLIRRLLDYSGDVYHGFHPRYLVAYTLAHLLPRFTAGPLIARLYRLAGFRIGQGTSFLGPVRVLSGTAFQENLEIGRGVLISTDVTINVDELVRIDDNASISPFVKIYTSTHRLGPSSRRMSPQATGKPVVIGSGAWVRLGAVILPGVTIGRGSVVGANSLVKEDVPANTYVEGNPAAFVRSLPL
jgi:acetyltransferase-like isoleucine patch superfamily enzyme